jgi:hypothetical protein
MQHNFTVEFNTAPTLASRENESKPGSTYLEPANSRPFPTAHENGPQKVLPATTIAPKRLCADPSCVHPWHNVHSDAPCANSGGLRQWHSKDRVGNSCHIRSIFATVTVGITVLVTGCVIKESNNGKNDWQNGAFRARILDTPKKSKLTVSFYKLLLAVKIVGVRVLPRQTRAYHRISGRVHFRE